MGAILCVAISAAWVLSVRRPRMPPWIAGCSVLTRPSMISGKPVWSETSVTFTPASRSALAEPPVDRISTPRPARYWPNSTSPALSDTEISARPMRARSGVGEGTYWAAADMATFLRGGGRRRPLYSRQAPIRPDAGRRGLWVVADRGWGAICRSAPRFEIPSPGGAGLSHMAQALDF